MPSKGHIFPQRHNGNTWQTVPVERATAWLVVPAAGGKPARFASKRAAVDYHARCARLAKPQRRFSFSSRCPPRRPVNELLAQGTVPRNDG